MSFVFGNSVFVNENEERVRGKQVIKNNGVGPQRRHALGTITNQVRVQPSRAAKPKGTSENFGCIQDENACSKSGKIFGGKESFQVYVDKSEVKERKPDPTSAEPTDAIVTLPRPVLSTAVPPSEDVIGIDDSPLESPMVLDTTTEDIEDKHPCDRQAIILTVPEYADDIYKYLREAEKKHRPKVGYMKKQPDITISMRSILVDWLVEVSEEYKLHRETLFLAVNYIDRFLSQMSVLRGKLQLVGAASMFLAAKYEEIYPPDANEFAYITDDTYTKKQVLRMEHLVLKVLSFDVAVPTTNWFCDAYLKSFEASDVIKSLTMYLAELTLVDSETYMKYLPSQIAASAVCLARLSMGEEPWSKELVKKAKYEISEFSDCMTDLHKTYLSASKMQQQAIPEKYKSSKHQEVSNSSLFPPLETLELR